MKIPVQRQTQIQTGGIDQVKEQTLPTPKEVAQPSLTNSTTDRSMGHTPETHIMSDHTIRPNINVDKFHFTQIH